MTRLRERVPGLVIVVGQLVVAVGSDRFQDPVVIAALMVIALSSLLLRSRDMLGLAAAVLLGSAASASSVAVVVTGCGAAVMALVVSSVLDREAARALGAWVALGAVCAALALGSVVELPTTETTEVSIDRAATEVAPDVVLPEPSPSVERPDAISTSLSREYLYNPTILYDESIFWEQSIVGSLGDGAINSVSSSDQGVGSETAWWMALLLFAASVFSLNLLRRVRAFGLPFDVVAVEDDQWGRLQRIARRSGVVRRPSESVLDFVERFADTSGDTSVIGIGELISAELYGEQSQRRSEVINRWLNLRDTT